MIGLKEFYLWELEPTETLFSANQAGLRGTWSQVSAEGINLPGNQDKGATCDATFFVHEVNFLNINRAFHIDWKSWRNGKTFSSQVILNRYWKSEAILASFYFIFFL